MGEICYVRGQRPTPLQGGMVKASSKSHQHSFFGDHVTSTTMAYDLNIRSPLAPMAWCVLYFAHNRKFHEPLRQTDSTSSEVPFGRRTTTHLSHSVVGHTTPSRDATAATSRVFRLFENAPICFDSPLLFRRTPFFRRGSPHPCSRRQP